MSHDADRGFDEFMQQLKRYSEDKDQFNDQAISVMRAIFMAGFDLGCSVTKAKIGITRGQLAAMVQGNFPPQ